jgi:hypothetical protein
VSAFSSPLKLRRTRRPLDEAKCRAEATSGTGWSVQWQQCQNKPNTTRPFADVAEPQPCCGVHANHYDKELVKHEARSKSDDAREKLTARCEVLLAKGVPCSPVYDTNTVKVSIDLLEQLVEKSAKVLG